MKLRSATIIFAFQYITEKAVKRVVKDKDTGGG